MRQQIKIGFSLFGLLWALTSNFSYADDTSSPDLPTTQRPHLLLYYGDHPDSPNLPVWEQTLYDAMRLAEEGKWDNSVHFSVKHLKKPEWTTIQWV